MIGKSTQLHPISIIKLKGSFVLFRHVASRVETSDDILKRAIEIRPLLAHASGPNSHVDIKTLVKAEVVGFRPTRQMGIRLEREATSSRNSVPIIHNYGHGGEFIYERLRRLG